MNIWRVKSKTGSTVHLSSDRDKTFCGREIKDDWKFIFLLQDRAEAFEHVDFLCSKCNETNLEEWVNEDIEGEDVDESKDSDTDSGRVDKEPDRQKNYADKPKGLGTW